MADITSEEAKKINEDLFGAEAPVSGEPVTAEEPAPPANEKPLDEAAGKRIEEFKNLLRDTIAEKSAEINNPDGRQRNESRIFQFLCENSKLNAEQCVDKYSAVYGGHPPVRNYEDFFKNYNIDGTKEREDFFNWAKEAVGTFISALKAGSYEKWKLYDNSDHKRLYSIRGKSRIFFAMLYHKCPDLFLEGVFENLQILNDDYAKDVHKAINRWIGSVCKSNDSAQESDSERKLQKKLEQAKEDNEHLQAQLKKTKKQLKELQARFDGSRSELVRFLSELNSSFHGRILDEIVNAYRAVKNLRKNNIQIPPEVKSLLPFAIHLAQFGHEKRFDYIIDIRKGDNIREMTNGEIEKYHGIYHGTEFKNNEEVKRVMITSPGWKYEDELIISPPEFQEYGSSEDK